MSIIFCTCCLPSVAVFVLTSNYIPPCYAMPCHAMPCHAMCTWIRRIEEESVFAVRCVFVWRSSPGTWWKTGAGGREGRNGTRRGALHFKRPLQFAAPLITPHSTTAPRANAVAVGRCPLHGVCEQATLLWRVFSSSSILRVWVEAKEAKALNNTMRRSVDQRLF